MTRITISLPDEFAVLLQREARRRRETVSELIRGALRGHLGIDSGTPSRLPFAGIGRSGSRHTARDSEKILAKEWSRSRHR